jgi:hypothetical protein
MHDYASLRLSHYYITAPLTGWPKGIVPEARRNVCKYQEDVARDDNLGVLESTITLVYRYGLKNTVMVGHRIRYNVVLQSL